MANALTGDFDAIVQVGTKTVYRLLATIHQNSNQSSGASAPPRLPHHLNFRIGDEQAVAGVRGWVTAQVGVPTFELTPSSEVGHSSVGQVVVRYRVRARFQPDPGTSPLVEFIHGQVRATFHVSVEPIADGIALRLTPSDDDGQITFESAELTATQREQVAQQIRHFVRSLSEKHPFVVPLGTPDFEFRAKALGSDVVAIPIGLPGGQSAPATMASVSQVFLGGSDVAIGIGKDYVLSLIQPKLDELLGWHPNVHVPIDGDAISDGHYDVSVTKADPKWLGNGNTATIHLSVAGTGSDPPYPDVAWTVDVDFTIGFDAGAFTVSAGEPKVTVTLLGAFGWFIKKADSDVETNAENAVRAEVKKKIKEVLGSLAPSIEGTLPGQEQKIENLLRAVDDKASVSINPPEFGADGIVVGANVTVSPRKKAPPVTIETLPDGSGYSAFANWFPGGWIERYEWKWSWWEVDPLTGFPVYTPSPEPPGTWPGWVGPGDPPGNQDSDTAAYTDRFVLKAPNLPGLSSLSGTGGGTAEAPTGGEVLVDMLTAHPKASQLCLRVSGVQVDPKTGNDVDYVHLWSWGGFDLVHVLGPDKRIEQELTAHVGLPGCWATAGGGVRHIAPIRHLRDPIAEDGLWWRGWLYDPGPDRGDWRAVDLDLFAQPAERSPDITTNTLLHFVGETADEGSLRAISQALRTSGRSDAGVLVLLVLREGMYERLGREYAETARALGQDLHGVQVMATEDIHGSWSRVFDVRAGTATRLIDARGRLAMRHDGPVDGAALAAALAQHLVPSLPRAQLFPLHPVAGREAPDFYFDLAPGRRVALHHLRGRRTALGFVRPWSVPCLAALRQLQGVHELLSGAGVTILGVVTEAEARDLEVLRREHGVTFPTVPDPRGALARAYEIHAWPTTVTIDADGEVRTRLGVDRDAILAFLGSASGRRFKAPSGNVRH
jgi:peroxiredoxin